MTVRRVMGIETEYGISVQDSPAANAMVTSSQVVNAYRGRGRPGAPSALGLRGGEPAARRPGLRPGPRGGRPEPAHRRGPRPGQRRSSPTAPGSTSTTPTPSTPRPSAPTRATAVIWDKAGERVMPDAARRAAAIPGDAPIQLYKNNTDNKGASYGCHENYLMRRATPFADIVRHLTPFFVSRQVVVRRGRVGIGAGRPRATASRSASGPTSSRSRWAWRPR